MGGGGEGGVRSRVTLCLSSRLDPVKVPGSEVTPKRERAQCYSERGEGRWCLSSTNISDSTRQQASEGHGHSLVSANILQPQAGRGSPGGH